jgi:hypothetical protein
VQEGIKETAAAPFTLSMDIEREDERGPIYCSHLPSNNHSATTTSSQLSTIKSNIFSIVAFILVIGLLLLLGIAKQQQDFVPSIPLGDCSASHWLDSTWHVALCNQLVDVRQYRGHQPTSYGVTLTRLQLERLLQLAGNLTIVKDGSDWVIDSS